MDIIGIIGLAVILSGGGYILYNFFKKEEIKKYVPKPGSGKVPVEPQPEPADGPSPLKPIKRPLIDGGGVQIVDEEEIQPNQRDENIK